MDPEPVPSTVGHVNREAPPPDERRAPSLLRSGPRRWFAVALLLAVVAHVPALPFDALFLARLFLHTPAPAPVEPPPADEELLIPVDLDLLADAPRAETTPAPATPPETPAAQPNAGAAPDPDPSPPSAPAASTVASPARPAALTGRNDAIYDDLDTPKTATATLKDPLSVAGGPGKFGPKNPFVQVLFNGNRLRDNSAGSALGGILTSLPEWKSFFEGTKIDPIADTEHLLIAGPQFRQSKDVVVWMQYRVPEADMKAAIDTLVARTKKGRWIEGAPVPAAIARAHGAARIFAMIPGKKLLVILPRKSEDQLAKLKTVKPFNQTSKAGIVISLATPRNAFAGFEDIIDVPATFKSLRMIVTPLADGGADVSLEITDKDKDEALKHAPLLEKQLSQVRTLAKIATVIGADVLPPMKVEVDRDILRVNATVTRKGLNHILNFARTHFGKAAAPGQKDGDDAKDDEEPSEKKEKKPEGGAAAPPSGSALPSPFPQFPTLPFSAPRATGTPSSSPAPGAASAAPSAAPTSSSK